MRKQFLALAVIVGVGTTLASTTTVTAQSSLPSSNSSVGFVRWADIGLRHGTVSGSAYLGPNGVTLSGPTGTWTSPEVPTNGQTVDSINPSWQAKTPSGSWVNIQLRVHQKNGAWSGWFEMGKWAFGSSPVRTSSPDPNYQEDSVFGAVFVDTYVNLQGVELDKYQVRVQLNASGNNRPTVRQMALQAATNTPFTQVSKTSMRQTIDLNLPLQLSQYELSGAYPQYGGGGEAWCSPTSTAMVLGHYGRGPSRMDLQQLPTDPVLEAAGRYTYGKAAYAAIHTFDEAYEGTGNWPFNTAYAAPYGIDSAVRIFPNLLPIENEIKHRNPVVVSIKWNNEDEDPNNDLPGAGIPKSNGHLMVVGGFTASGDVIAYDPAVKNGDSVRRPYSRLAFERQATNANQGIVSYTFARR